jgi:hypothetical protein
MSEVILNPIFIEIKRARMPSVQEVGVATLFIDVFVE